jgi:four helix bundle protein
MTENELKLRTKKFAVRTFWFVQKMGTVNGTRNIGWQLIDCSSSVAANYRAVCRGKSSKDFIHKLKVVQEEADESCFWLEFIDDLNVHPDKEELQKLHREANELTAIFTASIKTATRNNNRDSQ